MSSRLFGDDIVFQQRLLKCARLYTGRLDGVWESQTDAAYKEFLRRSEAIGRVEGVYDARTERNLWTLQLPAQSAARRLLRALTASRIDARIISGTRSYDEQNRLFTRGRYGNPGPRITNARGGRSSHNFGVAWDIGIFENGSYLTNATPYDRAANIGLAPGIEWGGHWVTFVDRPHYQLALDLDVSEVRRRFEAGKPYFEM